MRARLKELIIKRAVEQHLVIDVDGDIVSIFGNKYYVNCIKGEVRRLDNE